MSKFLRVMEAVQEVCASIHSQEDTWVFLIEIDYESDDGDSKAAIHWRGWIGEL